MSAAPVAYPRAVLFDLLPALLDSWTVWNAAAGSEYPLCKPSKNF
ncbi:hypothetical protein BOMU111920_14455 [Bordetella muralis]|jgi:2-haloacid dehalogenase